MSTRAVEPTETVDTTFNFSAWGKLLKAYDDVRAQRALNRSNRLFAQVEEQKYAFMQRHRIAVASLHGTPKAHLIDEQYFAVMRAVEAIAKANQSLEQRLEHQRMALQFGMGALNDIIKGRVRFD